MGILTLTSVNPLILLGVIAISAEIRVIGLAIALRGAAPGERPAIIRALAEPFRGLPRKRP